MITSPALPAAPLADSAEMPTARLTCRQFERRLAESLTRAQLPPAARRHLAACAACAALLEDFETIAQRVRALPALASQPMPDLWPQIRAVLLQEGIIHASGQECASTPPRRAPRLVHRSPLPHRR